MSKPLTTEIRSRQRWHKCPRGLSVTGQTSKYVDGDDGDLEVGYTQANRFVVGPALVFRDNFTGLYWPREWTSPPWNNGNVGQWSDAFVTVTDSNNAVYGGFSDWRFPNVLEILSLVDYSRTPTYWPDQPWINAGSGRRLWSSTTYSGATSQAYQVHMDNGKILIGPKTDVAFNNIVLCRGGPL